MKTRYLRRLIIAGSIVLTGLMTVQAYWFLKAFDMEERQFDHRVQIALMKVADSVSPDAEVKMLSSNFYFVSSTAQLDNQAIDNLVKAEFAKRDLHLDYELGVYNAEDDTLVYGQYVEATAKTRIEQQAVLNGAENNMRNFAVFFPRKAGYVAAQLDIWIFSTVALLLMMGFFAWAIVTLLKERKFSELKNDFIDNMTHEFKTPVTNIAIAAEVIRKKLPDATGLEVYLNILERENDILKRKIEKVLLGSSADQRSPSMQRIDVHQLIADCAESFQLRIKERSGVLRLSLNAKRHFILGDRDLISQAIGNLVDNAEKYSPGKPQISIATRDDGNAIAIDVSDSGVGIPVQLRSKVFGKFFRATSGNIHDVKGFGLGLSFVKSVILTHSGRITLGDALGHGTIVKLTLPNL